MRIVEGLMKYAVMLAMLTACSQATTPGVSATETAMCDVWQNSLPTRSREDTERTIAEIGHAYDVFEAVCEREVKL